MENLFVILTFNLSITLLINVMCNYISIYVSLFKLLFNIFQSKSTSFKCFKSKNVTVNFYAQSFEISDKSRTAI